MPLVVTGGININF